MNRAAKVLLFLLAVSFLTVATPIIAQDSTRLIGKVTDKDNKPISGALVSATNRSTGETVRANTDSSGRFMLFGMRDGVYRVVITKQGYKNVELEKRFSTNFPNRPVEVSMEAEGSESAGAAVTQEEAEAAVQQVREGKFEEALPVFLRVVEGDPGASWARLNAGVCLGGLNRYQEALEQFEAVLEAEPENINAIILAANTCLGMRDAAKALGYYELLSQHRSNDPEVWFTLGDLYNYAEKRDEAIQAYQKAVEIKEDYPDPHMKLGATFQVLEDYEQAAAHFERYLELAPDSAQAKQVRGMAADVHFELGGKLTEEMLYEEAIKHLERSLELAPDSKNAEEARSMIDAIKEQMEGGQT